jgi:hypothetical protein
MIIAKLKKTHFHLQMKTYKGSCSELVIVGLHDGIQ